MTESHAERDLAPSSPGVTATPAGEPPQTDLADDGVGAEGNEAVTQACSYIVTQVLAKASPTDILVALNRRWPGEWSAKACERAIEAVEIAAQMHAFGRPITARSLRAAIEDRGGSMGSQGRFAGIVRACKSVYNDPVIQAERLTDRQSQDEQSSARTDGAGRSARGGEGGENQIAVPQQVIDAIITPIRQSYEVAIAETRTSAERAIASIQTAHASILAERDRSMAERLAERDRSMAERGRTDAQARSAMRFASVVSVVVVAAALTAIGFYLLGRSESRAHEQIAAVTQLYQGAAAAATTAEVVLAETKAERDRLVAERDHLIQAITNQPVIGPTVAPNQDNPSNQIKP
jgi:hypothetical protein